MVSEPSGASYTKLPVFTFDEALLYACPSGTPWSRTALPSRDGFYSAIQLEWDRLWGGSNIPATQIFEFLAGISTAEAVLNMEWRQPTRKTPAAIILENAKSRGTYPPTLDLYAMQMFGYDLEVRLDSGYGIDGLKRKSANPFSWVIELSGGGFFGGEAAFTLTEFANGCLGFDNYISRRGMYAEFMRKTDGSVLVEYESSDEFAQMVIEKAEIAASDIELFAFMAGLGDRRPFTGR